MLSRVIVNGAEGKMGTLACATLRNHPDFQFVAGLTRGDNLQAAILDTKADIVVDLTRADCVYTNCKTIINNNARPIIGTTGLLQKQIEELTAMCAEKHLGGIIVPNFSIGAILMMRFAAAASRLLTEVEIIETHHQQKLDAPSGTALKTAEMIATARTQQKNSLSIKELLPGARGANHQEVPIHSLRLPGVIARQEVIFGNTGETLSIVHNCTDRSSFMPGLILACQKVLQLTTLHYGLESFVGT